MNRLNRELPKLRPGLRWGLVGPMEDNIAALGIWDTGKISWSPEEGSGRPVRIFAHTQDTLANLQEHAESILKDCPHFQMTPEFRVFQELIE